MNTMNNTRKKGNNSQVTGIYRWKHFVSILVCYVQSVGISIDVKQCIMPNYICILYLSIYPINT